MEKDLKCSRLMNATKAEEESQSQLLQTREVDGPGPSQPPDDIEAEEYHPRIPNVTDFVIQRCDAAAAADSNEGKDSHGNEHDGADHDDSHDEAYKNANSFIVRHSSNIDTNNKISNEQEERKQAATRSTTFPQHLMDVIEYESQYDKPKNIIDWVNGGDAFLIRDKVAFEQNILPQYFNRGRNKCKFISFVRKVYRWGFRQVERSSPDSTSMAFMHSNFIRGDKQRCLLMRSIVKRPVRTTSLRQSSADHQRVVTLPPQLVVLQEGRVVVDVPAAAAVIPLLLTHHPASTTSEPFGPRVGQQQVVPILPLSLSSVQNLACQQGLNCPTSLQISATAIPNRFPAAMTLTASVLLNGFSSCGGSGLHHSAEILERLSLQLQQQRQVEMVRHILVRIIDRTIAAASSSLPPAALASLPPQIQASLQPGQSAPVLGSPAGARFGYHHADFGRRLTTTGNMNVVDEPGGDVWVVAVLASQIMKSNPGIEPSRAIELAKKCLPGHDTFLGSSVT